MKKDDIGSLSFIASMLLLFFVLSACHTDLPEDITLEYDKLPEHIDYNLHVKPILSDKCFLCHGPDQAKLQADLRLDQEESATSLVSSSGRTAISPKSLNGSELFHRIISEDPEYMMPTPESNLELSAKEKAVIIKWIEEGAHYKPHWAFEKPIRHTIPDDAFVDWGINGIDHFVAQKLEEEHLEPAIEAKKELLLRRVSFDLTGLPPTIDDLESFINDTSSDAYEKQVDRLLASVHYGEKMAMDWMDLARYSDTHGYQADGYRDVSPWRDWVINSFNDNLAYDDFITWQLAGDLLENPSRDQILATTFNRLHPQNLEGGIIDEEYRVEYVADRVSIVGTGVLGMSIACAKCHDHKFDPISQKNFYEMFSFFNNVNETGQISWSGATPVPTLLLTEEKEQELIDYLDQLVKDKSITHSRIQKEALSESNKWIDDGAYQNIKKETSTKGLQGDFKLNGNLNNAAKRSHKGEMKREHSSSEVATYDEGREGSGLLLNGDAWFDLGKVGLFSKKDPFSIGLWVHIPEELTEGVLFHKNQGARIYSYRGYHLYLEDSKLRVALSHTWPENAIIEYSISDVPKDEWIHLMVTYDGSSKASGLKIFQNGALLETKVENDNLYKDILRFDKDDNGRHSPKEPGLQVGAWWRGVGIPGAKVDGILVYDKELSQLEILKIADLSVVDVLMDKSPDELSESDRALLQEYFVLNRSNDVQKSTKELRKVRSSLYDSIGQVKEIMVMKEMKNPRKAYVLNRGLYDSYGEEVFPGVPAEIMPWSEDAPKNRLGLASWLTDPNHPLTARVAVNRYWQNYFGRGLVRTTEDFGNQGEMPSHLELLDWLALEFIDSNWDVKALQKLIVMSATYRQRSQADSDLYNRDPDNVLLARGPTVRLSSEMIRDNALAASGLLNKTIGGESVRPYQPDGLWSMNTGKYVRDTGEKLYRRSLYTLWKRTVPNPTLYTFDQPDREVCTVRRQKTNTPLQALVLLNDPTFLEAAKVIGETITRSGASEESIATAFRRITGTEVEEEQLKVLASLQESEYQIFKKDKAKKKGWIESGDYKIDARLDADLVAANSIVASVILNSDACITKR